MRASVSVTNVFLFHAFTLFKGGRWHEPLLRRVTNEGCSILIINRSAYNKDSIPSSGAPRQLPPWGEAMHRDVFGTASASYTRSLHLVAFTGLPKSIEELFGKRSGRRNGQNGKRSAPSAMAPWRDEVGMTEGGDPSSRCSSG